MKKMINNFKLSQRSLRALAGVHPLLVAVVVHALQLSEVDFMVIEGVRTAERQAKLYAQGRTEPGDIVTWTMESNHFVNSATGFGHAVDLLPAPYDWKDKAQFKKVSEAMFAAAFSMNVKIRWGGDWNKNGKPYEKGETDSPHFELVV